MLPFRWPAEILDHRPEIELQELSHFLWLQLLHEVVEKSVALSARLLPLALVLVGADGSRWHVVEELIEDLMHQIVLLDKQHEFLVVHLLEVDVEELLAQCSEPDERLVVRGTVLLLTTLVVFQAVE